MNINLNKLPFDLRVLKGETDISNLIKQKIEKTDTENDSFYIVNLDDICQKHIKWLTALPRVEPHYAVKCNNDPVLIKLLAFLGAGFDCASKNEMKQILDLGVSSDRIIYANPCKQASMIKYAYKNDVDLMTFDNENELHKIKEHHPNAKLVLRIITNDADAVCRFSMKFGADMKTSRKLIDTAMRLNLDLVGISFHVGSGQMSPSAFSESIQNAKALFDYAAQEHNCELTLLDLGGGYPGSDTSSDLFNSIACEINRSLDLHFPIDEYKNVKVIAEPGRYYACSAFTLCVNIIAKRIMEEEEEEEEKKDGTKSIMYYINDGVYSSFNCIFYDHVHEFEPILLDNEKVNGKVFKSSIWGPTCDGLDCVMKECQLPEMDTGDFMAFKNMGAYTISGACPFNGIPLPKSTYIVSQSTWDTIKGAFCCSQTSECSMEDDHPIPYGSSCAGSAVTKGEFMRSIKSNMSGIHSVDSPNVSDETYAVTC